MFASSRGWDWWLSLPAFITSSRTHSTVSLLLLLFETKLYRRHRPCNKGAKEEEEEEEEGTL